MTVCQKCGMELQRPANPVGLGWGHTKPTTYRHYPRPVTRSADHEHASRRVGGPPSESPDVGASRPGRRGGCGRATLSPGAEQGQLRASHPVSRTRGLPLPRVSGSSSAAALRGHGVAAE